MATAQQSSVTPRPYPVRTDASIVRFAANGAIVAGIFFVLCWVGALLPLGPATHLYLQLFTPAEISSSLALAQGLCWSLVFGGILGALIAAVHSLLRRFG